MTFLQSSNSADNIDRMMQEEDEESRRSSLQSIQTRKTTNSSRKMMTEDLDSNNNSSTCCNNNDDDCGVPREVVGTTSSRSSMNSKDDSAPLRPCRRVSTVTLLRDAAFDEDDCSDADYSDSSEYDSDTEDEDEGLTPEDLGYGGGTDHIPTSKDLGYGEESVTAQCLDASAATLTSRGEGSDCIPLKPVKRMSTNKPLRNNFSIYGGTLGGFSDSDYDDFRSDDSDYSVSDSEDDEYEEDDFFGGGDDDEEDLTTPPTVAAAAVSSSTMMNTPRRISMDYGYQEDNPSLPTRVDLQFGPESNEIPNRISLQFLNSSSNSNSSFLMDSSDRSLRNGRLEVSIGTSGLKRQANSGRLSLSHSSASSLQQVQHQQQNSSSSSSSSPIPLAKPTLTRGTTIDLGSLGSTTSCQQQATATAQMWNPTMDHKRSLSPREQQALRRRLTMDHNAGSHTMVTSLSPQRCITRNLSSRPQRRTTMDHHQTAASSTTTTPERRITRNVSSRPMRRTTMDHCAPNNDLINGGSSTHSRTAPPQRGVNRYASSRPAAARRTTMDHYNHTSGSSSGNDLSSSSSHSRRTAPQTRGINRYTSSRQLPMRRTTMDHHAPSSSMMMMNSQRTMVQRSPSMSHCGRSIQPSSTTNSMTYCDHNGRLLATDLKHISPALSNKGSGSGGGGTPRRISMDTSKSFLGRVHPATGVVPSSAVSSHRRGRVLPQRNRSMGGRAA